MVEWPPLTSASLAGDSAVTKISEIPQMRNDTTFENICGGKRGLDGRRTSSEPSGATLNRDPIAQGENPATPPDTTNMDSKTVDATVIEAEESPCEESSCRSISFSRMPSQPTALQDEEISPERTDHAATSVKRGRRSTSKKDQELTKRVSGSKRTNLKLGHTFGGSKRNHDVDQRGANTGEDVGEAEESLVKSRHLQVLNK